MEPRPSHLEKPVRLLPGRSEGGARFDSPRRRSRSAQHGVRLKDELGPVLWPQAHAAVGVGFILRSDPASILR